MYSDFVFLDRFLFELSCKNTHTHTHTHGHTHTHTHTRTHTHRDSNEYPIVAFSKNATIIIVNNNNKLQFAEIQYVYSSLVIQNARILPLLIKFLF